VIGEMNEPFYFKSYDKVVGVAHNEKELEKEIMRIGSADPPCVNWHLEQGHIVAWLRYIGNNTLAEMLKGVKDYREALARIRDYWVLSENKKAKEVDRATEKRKARYSLRR